MSDFLESLGFGSVAFWEQIAGYAWNGFRKYGRGAVVIAEDEIREEGGRTALALRYLPEADESELWAEEPRRMLDEYEPETEVLLITMEADGNALCMIMETQDGVPSPPEAFRKLLDLDQK